jgi:hypothetical protein
MEGQTSIPAIQVCIRFAKFKFIPSACERVIIVLFRVVQNLLQNFLCCQIECRSVVVVKFMCVQLSYSEVYLRRVSEPADRARTRLQHPGRQTSARSQLRRGRLNRRAIVGEGGAHTSRRPHNRRPRTDPAASIKSRRVRRVDRRHPGVVDRAVKAVAGTLESVVQKPLGCRYGHRPRGTPESKYLEIEAVLKGRTFCSC